MSVGVGFGLCGDIFLDTWGRCRRRNGIVDPGVALLQHTQSLSAPRA